VTVDQVCTTRQKFGDGRELAGVELIQHRGHIFAQRLDHILYGRPLQCQLQNLLAPVPRIVFATKVSGAFESRDYPSDRAAGQASNCAEVATGHWPALAQQIEAFVIGWPQPEALRNSMVEQHHRRTVSAR
jgi:hypothetical protein